MQTGTQQNDNEKNLLKILLELNQTLVREQYRILLLKEIPKREIRPPYLFYLN